MNIDERLDKLTERHEALTQNVALLSIDVKDLAGEVKKLTRDLQQVTNLTRAMVGGIADLTTIVRSHEQRISGLENSV
jgi:chromosome segregation ATPase